jgi:hypothetical protein
MLWMTCGVAGGVAAAFHSPVGGVIFTYHSCDLPCRAQGLKNRSEQKKQTLAIPSNFIKFNKIRYKLAEF